MKLSERISRVRSWLLEDKALEGLGGPPNNWQSSPQFASRQHGRSTGRLWYSIRFDNDAFDVWISTQFSDESQSDTLCVMAAEDFRKLALWFLWRWAWGEWFGLRRWLFYKDLHRRMRPYRAQP